MAEPDMHKAREDIAEIFRIVAERGEKAKGPGGSVEYTLGDIGTMESKGLRIIFTSEGSVTERWSVNAPGQPSLLRFVELEPQRVSEIAQRLKQTL